MSYKEIRQFRQLNLENGAVIIRMWVVFETTELGWATDTATTLTFNRQGFLDFRIGQFFYHLVDDTIIL